jgi:hypothetical protein
MYAALNEDYMIQEVRDRTARMNRIRRDDNTRPNRRWWRRSVRSAR